MCPSAPSLPIVRGRDWLREQASKARVSDVSVGVITADCEVGEIVCVSRLEVCGEADGSSERN